MPQLGLTMTEGRVVEWRVAVGDAVSLGQCVATIESEKTQEDVLAESDGILVEIVASADETVPVGGVIGRIRVGGPANGG